MIKLKLTCGACPEQYDAFLKDEAVGYLRLRHGHFRAEHSDGAIVYEAWPKGGGVFEEEERNFYLNRACKAIEDYMSGICPVEEIKEEEPQNFYIEGDTASDFSLI